MTGSTFELFQIDFKRVLLNDHIKLQAQNKKVFHAIPFDLGHTSKVDVNVYRLVPGFFIIQTGFREKIKINYEKTYAKSLE